MLGQHASVFHVAIVAVGHHHPLRKGTSTRQDTAWGILISAGFDVAQEMDRLRQLIDAMNRNTFNPAGLNIVWPKNVAFLFVSDRPPDLDVSDADFTNS